MSGEGMATLPRDGFAVSLLGTFLGVTLERRVFCDSQNLLGTWQDFFTPRSVTVFLSKPSVSGGSEGLMMLNRTLSANLNGLNLGTRTTANFPLAAVNNVISTLRVRHLHPQMRKDSMRGGDAKLRGDSSISDSIRGCLPSIPSPGSPISSLGKAFPGLSSEVRCEVVVACPVEARFASRATWGAWSQTLSQQQLPGWPGTAITRAKMNPATTFVRGG